jgi:putative oxidoreductase
VARDDIAAFALRVGVGSTFAFAGLEKVARGPAFVVPYFSSLGIPWPDVLGPLIGAFELVGGVALVLGILVRTVAAAFVAEMVVAVLVARLSEVVGARGVVEGFTVVRLEVLLALSSTAIAALGAGRWTAVSLVVPLLYRRRDGSDDASKAGGR